jgi:hypothetical protein
LLPKSRKEEVVVERVVEGVKRAEEMSHGEWVGGGIYRGGRAMAA